MSAENLYSINGELVEMKIDETDTDKVEVLVIVDKNQFKNLAVNLLYKRVSIQLEKFQQEQSK